MSFPVEFHPPGLLGSALKVFGGWVVGGGDVEGDFNVKLRSKRLVQVLDLDLDQDKQYQIFAEDEY